MKKEMNANGERISRRDLFIEMAILMSKRSSCMKKAVGAILLDENRIIATSYNGVLPHEKHSNGLAADGVTTNTVHAETNLIAFCAKKGIPTNNTTLYLTLSPCEKCAEMIIQAGITEVVYLEEYRDDAGIKKLLENDIRIGMASYNQNELDSLKNDK